MAVGGTRVVQVTNIAPQATKDQMQTLFGYLGKIEDIRLYPTIRDVSCPVQSRICYIKFIEASTVGIAQHMTNTVFIDRALIVIPVQNGEIPDEYYALEMTKNGTIVPGLCPTEPKLPPNVVNSVSGIGTEQVIITTDPHLQANNLPLYPPLPANYDSVKIEEVRRTILIHNIDPTITTDELVSFFSKAGEIKYFRTCTRTSDNTNHLLVEFSEQPSILEALKYNGKEFKGKILKITHATQAISKPQAKSNEIAQREIEEAMSQAKEAQSDLDQGREDVDADLDLDQGLEGRVLGTDQEDLHLILGGLGQGIDEDVRVPDIDPDLYREDLGQEVPDRIDLDPNPDSHEGIVRDTVQEIDRVINPKIDDLGIEIDLKRRIEADLETKIAIGLGREDLGIKKDLEKRMVIEKIKKENLRKREAIARVASMRRDPASTRNALDRLQGEDIALGPETGNTDAIRKDRDLGVASAGEDRQRLKEAEDVVDREAEIVGKIKKTVKVLKIDHHRIQKCRGTMTKRRRVLIQKEIRGNLKSQIIRRKRNPRRNRIIWIFPILLSL
ncbi:hypothetical protein Trydic_g5405 [Trypoxylus dichotomus]